MRNTLLTIAFAVLSLGVSAQQNKSHYITMDLGGGLQSINYDMGDFGNRTGAPGINARLGYQFFLNPNLGVGTGIQFQTYESKAELLHVQSAPAIDDDGDKCESRVYYNGISETQKLSMLSIPVGVYYQKPLGEKLSLMCGLGLQFGFSVSNTYDTDGSLDVRGWYETPKLELHDIPEHHYYSASGFSGDFDIKTAVQAFMNVGAYYKLCSSLEIGALIYGNIGFNKLADDSSVSVYDPDVETYSNPIYNGVLGSEAAKNCRTKALGLAVSARFRIGN